MKAEFITAFSCFLFSFLIVFLIILFLSVFESLLSLYCVIQALGASIAKTFGGEKWKRTKCESFSERSVFGIRRIRYEADGKSYTVCLPKSKKGSYELIYYAKYPRICFADDIKGMMLGTLKHLIVSLILAAIPISVLIYHNLCPDGRFLI